MKEIKTRVRQVKLIRMNGEVFYQFYPEYLESVSIFGKDVWRGVSLWDIRDYYKEVNGSVDVTTPVFNKLDECMAFLDWWEDEQLKKIENTVVETETHLIYRGENNEKKTN